MSRATADPRPGRRLAPVLWAGIAVAVAAMAFLLVAAPTASTAAVLVGSTVTRAGMNAAGVACVGLALVRVLLPPGLRGAGIILDRTDRALVTVAGGWLVLVLAGITFRAADAFGRPVSSLSGADLALWAGRLAAGRGMVLTGLCAAVVLGLAIVALRRPDLVPGRVALVAALLGVVTPAGTGHAGSAPDHQLAVIASALHVGAAALWVGGLGAMLVLVAGRRSLLDPALPRFSRLAGVCVVAVALTGVLSAQVRLPSWEALFTTGYGGLVVAKTACLVLLAGLGGLARRRLAAGRAPVLRWAGAETAVMAATIGLAAALAQTG